MRRRALAFICVLSAAAAATPAGAGAASGIKGRVVNTTCYGPCIYPPPPPPLYTGAGLRVSIRRLATGKVVSNLRPDDGRFRVRLRRGRYSVTARVQGDCWSGETRHARVRDHRFTKVELEVANVCVV